MKPRVVIDLKGGKDLSRLKGLDRRVDLKNRPFVISIPIKLLAKTAIILFIGLTFVFGSVTAPVEIGVKAAQDNQTEQQRRALEEELAKYEKEIEQHEVTIELYKKQGKTLSGEITNLAAQIKKLSAQIKAINLNLKKLDEEISQTQTQIIELEGDVDVNRKNLSKILQTLYEGGNKAMLEILLSNAQISDFFSDLNNLVSVQDNLRVTLERIIELKDKLNDQKEVLAIQRSDTATLKAYQDTQRAGIQKVQEEKDSLLKVTKNKESEYQKILTETKRTAAEIRKQIFKLIGGGELDFDKAYELAKFAEKATGVRAALILAVLDRESALGKNVGQCDYKTAMSPTRDIPVFLVIIKELGLEKDLESGIIKVSCANSDGYFGGAMGPAQFIPSTWAMYAGYKKNNNIWTRNPAGDRVGGITGSNPSNPWGNTDAFVATALYLKDAGADNNEKVAAAKYYCGGNWNRYTCTNVYGAAVVNKAKQFQDDIDVLNS